MTIINSTPNTTVMDRQRRLTVITMILSLIGGMAAGLLLRSLFSGPHDMQDVQFFAISLFIATCLAEIFLISIKAPIEASYYTSTAICIMMTLCVIVPCDLYVSGEFEILAFMILGKTVTSIMALHGRNKEVYLQSMTPPCTCSASKVPPELP